MTLSDEGAAPEAAATKGDVANEAPADRIQALEDRVAQLEAQNEALADRLAAIEAQMGLSRATRR